MTLELQVGHLPSSEDRILYRAAFTTYLCIRECLTSAAACPQVRELEQQELPRIARQNITTPAGSSNLGHQATPWRKGRTKGKAGCECSPQVRLVRVTDYY